MDANKRIEKIQPERLLKMIEELGHTGLDDDNRLSRVALTNENKAGRDLLVSWMKDTGLEVEVDRIGNIFGIWRTEENSEQAPLMLGSHIDSVIDAGKYDGCYGVLSGLEVIRTLKESGFYSKRPIVVGAFTNEEGVRYQPDMMGSLVYAGGLSTEKALETVGTDGTILSEELKRIGYAGEKEPGYMKPYAYIELHVEQGPILDKIGTLIGAVQNLQGISWQQVTIEGLANHAGTTPSNMRKDAGVAAARIITYLNSRGNLPKSQTVATVGTIDFSPNLINVIPSKAVLTVDLRNPINEILCEEEKALVDFFKEVEITEGVKISTEQLVRFDPVAFDQSIVKLIEKVAKDLGFSVMKMTSGAGHDAQMMSQLCPTAMIFVPSIDGISHNPNEITEDEDIVSGANVLLNVVYKLTDK